MRKRCLDNEEIRKVCAIHSEALEALQVVTDFVRDLVQLYTLIEFAAQGRAWSWRSFGNVELRRVRVDRDEA